MNSVLSRPEQHVDAAPLMALVSVLRNRKAVAGVRHWLTDILIVWGLTDEQIDDAVLALSEVVANAVEHAAGNGHSTITAALWQGHLRITVSDPDPELHGAADDDEHGRGLLVVKALTTRHGASRIVGGKVVWFEQLLTIPGASMAGTCCECGHSAGCDCDCCPYPLPAVAAAASIRGAR